MSKAIVTHGGPRAHFDEFTAISLLLAASDAVEVWRKEPDYARSRTDIIFVDVGGEHDPEKMNFDHHQDEDLPSSLGLVARYLEIEEAAHQAFEWWEYKDVLDTSGPRAAAEAVGVEGDTRPLASPIEGYMLDWFAEQEEYVKPKLLEIMEDYGQRLLDRIEEFEKKLQEAREEGELVEVEGIPTYLLPQKDADSGVLRALRGELEFDATITSDPRSGGFSAYRYDDLDYEIDMSGVEGEDVHFAHNSGFLATTASVEAAKEALAEGLR